MDDSTSSSADVNDVWASLRDGENDRLSEYRKRAAALKSKSKISVVGLIKKTEKRDKEKEKAALAAGASEQPLTIPKEKKKKTTVQSTSNDLDIDSLSLSEKAGTTGPAKGKHVSFVSSAMTSTVSSSNSTVTVTATATATVVIDDQSNDSKVNSITNCILIKANEMQSKIARDLNLANSDDMNDRRRALEKLQKTLFIEHTMTTADYNEIFRESCKLIFKRYSDVSEKCRELSLKITQSFFERSSDLVPVLAYFFPMLMQRLPSGLAYDEDMKVFVTNMEMHEAYRRGKAVDRQDKTGGCGVWCVCG